MTQALADVLAEIDDPELVERLLDELGDSRSRHERSSSSEKSLEEWYETYLKRRQNRSPSTRSQYKRTIPTFLTFAADRNITSPVGLTTTLVEDYVDMLFESYETDATILTYIKNVRAWLQWLEPRTQCSDSLPALLSKEDLGLSPTARDVALPKDEAKHILRKLRRQRRGSAQHAVLELAWNSGLRLGGLHSLDLDDLDLNNNDLSIRHRPEEGTRLKNGEASDDTAGNGERDIALHPNVVDALCHYIELERPSVTDDSSREPLFATVYGRASKSTLRRWIYSATSCRWAADGPETATCDGSCDPDMNVCSCSYYPHAVRRGSIVEHLSGGLRPDRASQRFNVTPSVLEKHYDPRTPAQRKSDREDAVKDAWSEI